MELSSPRGWVVLTIRPGDGPDVETQFPQAVRAEAVLAVRPESIGPGCRVMLASGKTIHVLEDAADVLKKVANA